MATSSLVRTYAGLNSLSSSSTAAGFELRCPGAEPEDAVRRLHAFLFGEKLVPVLGGERLHHLEGVVLLLLELGDLLGIALSNLGNLRVHCRVDTLQFGVGKGECAEASSIWSRVTPETTTFLTLVFAIVIKMKVGYFFLLAPSNIR